MRRILGLTSILFMMSVAPVYAGHGHGGGGGPVVRDHRSGGGGGGGPVYRDHRSGGGGPVYHDNGRYVRHGPVRAYGGRYVFPGGVVRVVHRPVYRHYYDVHMRPAVIVEAYDPVPGYIWVGGNWRWGGAEWIWVPGYWSVEAAPPSVGVSAGFSAGVVVH